ncbi:maleylpyruvate isomerase family mycothiol-dependent enzyme [Actinomadura atramentaria]|uniref:maleylpyruvate isomerase family mycothiol-dependent enzyme n=1 Tax=Actinomadura atramentaria TaxID=1990 RepID=UPI00035D3586|nr:maleylpyruvate isomerase family mycothiol-dependent enzyme [Actinomadura atramentaria]
MTDPRWTHDAYCDAVEREVAAFGAAARELSPDAAVPSCPGWSAADLVRHLGGVHRWAAGLVATRTVERAGRRAMGVTVPDDDAELPSWYAEGGAALPAALRGAPPATPVFTWGDEGTAGWWARRMVHETAVHRCDLDLAAGRDPAVDTATAVDGVGELLANLRAAGAFSPRVAELRGAGALAFAATDADVRWWFRLHPDGFTWEREDAGGGPPGADAVVAGPAAELYLFAWGRRAPGDRRLHWHGDDALIARFADDAGVM